MEIIELFKEMTLEDVDMTWCMVAFLFLVLSCLLLVLLISDLLEMNKIKGSYNKSVITSNEYTTQIYEIRKVIKESLKYLLLISLVIIFCVVMSLWNFQ